jgi:transposase-like protein
MNAVKLDRWEHHILAARERGQTIKAYAREHGLSAGTLYCASQMMLHRDRSTSSTSLTSVASTATSAFVAVKMRASVEPAALRVQLRNGVALELRCSATDGAVMHQLIAALGELPCSD